MSSLPKKNAPEKKSTVETPNKGGGNSTPMFVGPKDSLNEDQKPNPDEVKEEPVVQLEKLPVKPPQLIPTDYPSAPDQLEPIPMPPIWKDDESGGIDYDRLLQDGKLEIGIGIGQEFEDEADIIHEYLLAQEFSYSKSKDHVKSYTTSKAFATELGFPMPVDVNIELIYERTGDPKDKMLNFLENKEVVLYSGHSKYGTGMDFVNHKKEDNLNWGINTEAHDEGQLSTTYPLVDQSTGLDLTSGANKYMKSMKGKGNDIEGMTLDANQYRLWFMNGCKTNVMRDEVFGSEKHEGLIKDQEGHAIDSENVSMITSNALSEINPMAFLHGLLSMQSMEEIIANLNKEQHKMAKRKNKKKDKNYFSN